MWCLAKCWHSLRLSLGLSLRLARSASPFWPGAAVTCAASHRAWLAESEGLSGHPRRSRWGCSLWRRAPLWPRCPWAQRTAQRIFQRTFQRQRRATVGSASLGGAPRAHRRPRNRRALRRRLRRPRHPAPRPPLAPPETTGAGAGAGGVAVGRAPVTGRSSSAERGRGGSPSLCSNPLLYSASSSRISSGNSCSRNTCTVSGHTSIPVRSCAIWRYMIRRNSFV